MTTAHTNPEDRYLAGVFVEVFNDPYLPDVLRDGMDTEQAWETAAALVQAARRIGWKPPTAGPIPSLPTGKS